MPRILLAAILCLAGCATAPSSSDVRITSSEEAVSGCERLAEVVVVADHIPMPEQGYAGTDTLDKTRGPDGGYSVRYWAARKGGDTILVTSVKPSLTKAIAFRCGTY